MQKITSKISQLSPALRIIISGGFIFLIAVASYDWLLWPQMSNLYAARRYETISQETAKASVAVKKQITTRQNEIKKLTDQINSFAGSGFTLSQAEEFFEKIEPAAAQAGCVVRRIGFLPNQPDAQKDVQNTAQPYDALISAFDKRSVSVDIEGAYRSIVDFISMLYDRPQRLNIDFLDLRLLDTGKAQLSCKMIITIYVLDDKNKEVSGK